MCEEVVVAFLEALSQHIPEGAEEVLTNPGETVSGLKLEPGIS
jgi:hypothetical protein